MFPRSLDDLLEVGCLHADSIVVVGFGSRGQTSDEDHMADATTIVDVQNIYRYTVFFLPKPIYCSIAQGNRNSETSQIIT